MSKVTQWPGRVKKVFHFGVLRARQIVANIPLACCCSAFTPEK